MYSRAYKAIVSVPPLLWVGLFLLLPYALLLAHSFWLVRDGFIVHQWNFRNYAKLFDNPVYVEVLFRSMRIAASVMLLSLLLGYPLAYFMSFHAGVGKDLLYQLVIVPLWVSYLVRGYAWKTILGSDGVLNGFLQYLHITHQPVSFFLYSPFAVTLTLTHIYTPFVFLPLYAWLEHIPRNLIEASEDLGAGPGSTFSGHSPALSSRPPRRGHLRFCSDPWRLSRAHSGGWPIERNDREHRAKSLWHRIRLATRRRHRRVYPLSYRLGPLPYRTAGKKVVIPVSVRSYRSGRAPFLAGFSLLVFAFLYLPIVVLILYSFNRDGVGGFPPRHFTLHWYQQLFADGAIWDSVLNSLLVAAGAVALSLTLGLLAALALDRADFPGKSIFRRLVLLPLVLPGIITGLSLLMLAVSAGLHLSLFTVFLGHGTALLSVATTELFAGLQKMDRAQEEASLDLGATPWQTFCRITLPNLKLSLVAAGLLIFTLSMDEIAVTIFLIGRDNTAASGNLEPPAHRHHTGNQRYLYSHFRPFRSLDFGLVPDPNSHSRQ